MASTRRRSDRKVVTMRDVAKLANVSQSTVSRVLRGVEEPIPIGEETQKRVKEAARQLKYQPNLHAGSLRGQKTRMVAMMIADITNPFYHPMIRAIQDTAEKYGYDVMIANSDHTRDGEMRFVESVLRRPVDGIVLTPYYLNDADLSDLIDRTGAAVVALGQHLHHPLVDIVFGKDGQVVFDAITWLHEEKGHAKIAMIGVTTDFPVGKRRLDGYQHALIQAGLPLRTEYYQKGDWTPKGGYAAMQKFLDLPEPPTAVFAANDLMAIGAMQAIKARGLRIPNDVALIGFDNIPASSWVTPCLTTLAQDPGTMGGVLAKAVFERIEDEYNGPGRRIEVPCNLIKREST